MQVTSNYSFLRGASHVEELLVAAKVLDLPAVAITDHDTLAGTARAHARAEEVGIRPIVGCRLSLRDSSPVLAYPLDRPGYARLCRLLTLGKGRTGKGGCDLSWRDLVGHGEGLLLILLPDAPDDRLAFELARMRVDFCNRCYLSLSLRRRPGDQVRLRQLHDLAQVARVPTVVTGDVLFHEPSRRILQDVVTCIREGCTIDEAGFRRKRFADRHLKAPDEMARLYAAYSAFRSAIGRGAVPLWMPRLEPEVAQEIEGKRLQFGAARDGQVPTGAKFGPIGAFERSMIRRWLDKMEREFNPILSWLP